MKVLVDGVPWRVWFIHRPELQRGQGVTTVAHLCRVNVADGTLNVSTRGWARCSVKDTYSRAKGRKVALARALAVAGLTKDQRAQVWNGLFDAGMRF